jgi:hypothetical protein
MAFRVVTIERIQRKGENLPQLRLENDADRRQMLVVLMPFVAGFYGRKEKGWRTIGERGPEKGQLKKDSGRVNLLS